MNLDFGLELTPANARRLIDLSKICQMEIDEQIINLAEQDRVQNTELFPLDEIALAATQYIIDCKFRCAIPRLAASIDKNIILNAISISNISKITIVGLAKDWEGISRRFKSLTDVEIVSADKALSYEYNQSRRDGLLIIDFTNTILVPSKTKTNLAKEYTKSIVYWEDTFCDLNKISMAIKKMPIDDIVSCLFPNIPEKYLKYTYFREIVTTSIWNVKKIEDIYPFFNVFVPTKPLEL